MGMGGVQRTLKFAKYLTQFGWTPTVITDSPKKYFAIDKSLLREAIDNNINIERTGEKEFNPDAIVVKAPNERLRKLRSITSSFVFIPDSKIGWKKKALKKIDEIWEKYGGFDVVFATAPPYTDFLIGLEVKRKYTIPLVIDYRDAWVDSAVLNYYPTPLHKHKNIKLESEVIKLADVIITTNRRVKEYILSRYDNLEYNDIKIIPHGYDKEDFEIASSGELPETNKFRITYAGSFYTRNAEFYFKGIKIFFDNNPDLKDKVEFCFVCNLTKDYKELIEKLGITSYIKETGYLEHIECVKYIMSSDILFLYISRGENDEAAMPGKVGEYIGSGKNILASIPEGVTKKMLENYNAVKFVDEEPEQIANSVHEYYQQSLEGKLPTANNDIIDLYDRKKLTEDLAKELNYLLVIE